MKMNNFSERLSYDPESGEIRWKVGGNRRIVEGALAGTVAKTGRLQIKLGGKCYLAHRIAWALVHGEMPKGEIDHIDGNPLNNRLSNLRDVDRTINAQNRRRANKGNASGFLGARRVIGCIRKPRWDAVINVNRKTVVLGRFDSPEAAHECYVLAKREVHAGCTL